MISYLITALNKAFSSPEIFEERGDIQEIYIEEEVEITVPNIGGQKAEVIEICISQGAVVNTEQSLVILESDKCTLEVPSPCMCKIEEAYIRVGSIVKENDPLFRISPHS